MFRYIFVFLIALPITIFANFYDDITKDKCKAAEEIEKNYQTRCSGSGGGCMYGVKFIALSFEIERPLSIEEARKIMVGSMAIVQRTIDNDKKIRPYLEEYPFPVERIELSFFIRHPEAKDFTSFSTFKNEENCAFISYNKMDSNDHLKNVLLEKFDKAKELIDEK